MKKVFHLVLTILTIALLAFLSFAKLNTVFNWVDLTGAEGFINVLGSFGPVFLLCLFAFGSLFGKIAAKILFVVILLLLLIFTVSMFAPQWLASIFGASGAFVGI